MLEVTVFLGEKVCCYPDVDPKLINVKVSASILYLLCLSMFLPSVTFSINNVIHIFKLLDCAEMERKKKEEAERKAKLDEIAEKQRQRERELEEKERQRREELLGRSNAVPARHTVPSTMAHPAEAAPVAPASAAASPAKYVPRFKRTSAEAGVPAPPPESDKWTSGRSSDDQTSQQNDRWRDDRRSAFGGGGGGGGPRSTWSSRNRG